MQTNNQKAFSMIELIFVIIIIGILAAIALPKFGESAKLAHTAKASSELATVRAALSTERQKRILRGDTADITGLGTVFSAFASSALSPASPILQYPPTACSGTQTGCWTGSGASFTYKFVDSGDAVFKLFENKLVCDNDASDCAKLE